MDLNACPNCGIIVDFDKMKDIKKEEDQEKVG